MAGTGLLLPRRRASSPPRGSGRGDIQQLIEECTEQLARDPSCVHTRAVRGHACMKAKRWEMAIADFSRILEFRPEDVHGRFSRGMALFKSGRVEAAHSDFTRVLELNPEHVMARYARAGCFNTKGEFHCAIQDYTIALEHDERDHGLRSEKLPRGWHEHVERLVHQTLNGGGDGDAGRGSGRRVTTGAETMAELPVDAQRSDDHGSAFDEWGAAAVAVSRHTRVNTSVCGFSSDDVDSGVPF